MATTKAKETKKETTSTVKRTTKSSVAKKKYGERDMVLTRSITAGELIYIGQKSRNRYVWGSSGDTAEVEVGDLNYLKYTKSPYLYTPYFIIEDEEFLSQPSWKDVREMYEEVKDNDINNILNLPLSQFKAVLPTLKEGYKNALLTQMSTLIDSGEFDSINKIKAVDEAYGTTLIILIQ